MGLNNNKNCKNIIKYVKYKISIISLIIFLLFICIIIIINFLLNCKINLLLGLILGYLFSFIGFVVILFSEWLLNINLNKFFFILFYLVRLIIYSIPILIYKKYSIYLNIYTIIIGLNIFSWSPLFIHIKCPIIKNRKKIPKKWI